LEEITRVETARGNTQISAFEDSDKKMASASFDLPNASLWKSVSSNSYSTRQLFRRANYNGESGPAVFDYPLHVEGYANFTGAQMAEIARTIRTNQGSIILTETLYINGRKTDWVTWELNR